MKIDVDEKYDPEEIPIIKTIIDIKANLVPGSKLKNLFVES